MNLTCDCGANHVVESKRPLPSQQVMSLQSKVNELSGMLNLAHAEKSALMKELESVSLEKMAAEENLLRLQDLIERKGLRAEPTPNVVPFAVGTGVTAEAVAKIDKEYPPF